LTESISVLVVVNFDDAELKAALMVAIDSPQNVNDPSAPSSDTLAAIFSRAVKSAPEAPTPIA